MIDHIKTMLTLYIHPYTWTTWVIFVNIVSFWKDIWVVFVTSYPLTLAYNTIVILEHNT